MSRVVFEDQGGNLVVRYSGRLVYPDLVVLTEEILKRCGSLGRRRVLLDVTESTGDLSVIGRYRIGRFMARTWDRSVRLAVVVRAEHVLPDRFWEAVTRNRGLDTGAFVSENEALEWLAAV